MAAFPTEIKPGDEDYATYFQTWVTGLKPGYIENPQAGWLYRVIFPNGGDEPTFTLIVGGSGTTRENSYPYLMQRMSSLSRRP